MGSLKSVAVYRRFLTLPPQRCKSPIPTLTIISVVCTVGARGSILFIQPCFNAVALWILVRNFCAAPLTYLLAFPKKAIHKLFRGLSPMTVNNWAFFRFDYLSCNLIRRFLTIVWEAHL